MTGELFPGPEGTEVRAALPELLPLCIEEISRQKLVGKQANFCRSLERPHYLGHRGTVGENMRYLVSDGGCDPIPRFYVRTSENLDQQTAPTVSVRRDGSDGDKETDGLIIGMKQMFQTNNVPRWDPRRWHVRLEVPADAPAGNYLVEFSGAEKVVALETDAPEIALAE